ncbi:unnamed protein product [Leptosia nina]|uniref:protein-tyrosine-phosphatase n=1 Tax=Leptosia nina TaxID=320188 RepID=A0AAV1JKM8_9NEOP
MQDEEKPRSIVEVEYMNITNENSWPVIYQKIGKESLAHGYTCNEARKAENKHLNRYRDVNPYDHSRVILQRCDGDYINANYVKLDRANRKYILTQGPLKFTVNHFWSMVFHEKSKAILMLNKLFEKNEVKCHQYWPNQFNAVCSLKEVNLEITFTSVENFGYYIVRKILLHDTITLESRVVLQFHYITWPDFGVPSSPKKFLDFLKAVRASGALEPDCPAIVHCSAGIGRSGTFCLVDSCLAIMQRDGQDTVNIQEILKELRQSRMGLIQTPDQLRFSYQAIIEGLKRLAPDYSEEDSSHIYAAVPEEAEEAGGSEITPPPPPPRGESLGKSDAVEFRPLPPIPTSTSLDLSIILC